MATPHVPQRWMQAVVRKAADIFWPRSALGFGTSFYHPMSGIETSGPEVGLGLLRASVLMAPIQWLMRAWPEAELVVRQRKRGQTEYSVIDGHPLSELLRMPNAYYSGEALWMVTVWSWAIFGNVYWRIVSTRGGVPTELWWVPPWQIYPAWPTDGREFISHYEYTPEGGAPQQLPLDQVIHFRHSLDPANPRVGLSPIVSVLREIAVDEEASNWIAALLRNMAVPGLLITPSGDATLSPEEVERVKRYIQSRFTGDARGEPLAFGAPTTVQKLSHSPSEMDLSPPRNTAEERVCACFGLPPAVVGFGTGLDTTKVGATMREMVGLAWSNALIPPQRIMAGELQRSLLPRFERQETVAREIVERRLTRLEVGWDYSSILALQEDSTSKVTRFNIGVQGGWIKVSEARAAANLEVSDEDDIYLRSNSVSAVDPEDQMPEPEPVPLALQPGGLVNAQGREDADEEETEAEQEAASYTEGISVKQGTTPEEFINTLIMRRAVKLETPPAELSRLASRMYRMEEKLRTQAARLLIAPLERLGVRVARANQEALPFPFKQSLTDRVKAKTVVDTVPMAVVEADFAEVYEALYTLMATEMINVLGEGLDLPTELSPVTQRKVLTAVQERVRLLNLPSQVQRSLISIFEQASAEGLDEQALAKLIEQEIPRGRWRTVETRAMVMARSESRYAASTATIIHAQDSGLTHFLVFDARLGPTDEACLPAGTAVVALEPQRGFRRWFEGDLVEITTHDGYFLAATGNHPILTDHGWVLADQLKEGDYVVRCLDPERTAMRAARQRGPDDQDMPACRQQGFDLLGIPDQARAIGQALCASDFNGERFDSEVNAIATKSFLRGRDDISLGQHGPESLFIGAIELAANFSSQSRLDRSGEWDRLSSQGIMSRLGFRQSLLYSQSTIHQGTLLTSRPQDKASLPKQSTQQLDPNALFAGGFFHGQARAVVAPGHIDVDRASSLSHRQSHGHMMFTQDALNDRLADMENGHQLCRTLASEVTLDQIVCIKLNPFHGFVYNLQTRQGWYSANSIITHNCEARNGLIVTGQEAQMLAQLEHANGTYGVAPMSVGMLQRAGVI